MLNALFAQQVMPSTDNTYGGMTVFHRLTFAISGGALDTGPSILGGAVHLASGATEGSAGTITTFRGWRTPAGGTLYLGVGAAQTVDGVQMYPLYLYNETTALGSLPSFNVAVLGNQNGILWNPAAAWVTGLSDASFIKTSK